MASSDVTVGDPTGETSVLVQAILDLGVKEADGAATTEVKDESTTKDETTTTTTTTTDDDAMMVDKEEMDKDTTDLEAQEQLPDEEEIEEVNKSVPDQAAINHARWPGLWVKRNA